MLKKNRFLGGILLVAGTTIGAGMLAIPVVTSLSGFFPSVAMLVFCWLFFFLTGWLLLDVNLACSGEVNLITMAGRWLGPIGKAVCWVAYLLLLYSLTAAYIAGSAPLFLNALHDCTGWNLPEAIGPIPLLILFGLFVYMGTRSVDQVNRLLMSAMVLSYIVLINFIPTHIQPSFLLHTDFSAMWIAVPILFTAFGFHIIIPTLTTYQHRDKKKLRLTIFWGSFAAFLMYLIWELLVLGAAPLGSLVEAWRQGEAGTAALQSMISNPLFGIAANLFSFFAIITSFLGVSLSLSDFLADGLQMKRFTWGREFACLLTFIPPLLFVYMYPKAFLLALQYAGVFVAIVICILPALMAWKLPQYRSLGRRFLLIFVILIALFAIILGTLSQTNFVQHVQTES
ncbi:MAG TPA: aromatic amino acid transport family protein [Chlamydiales bacterium]|nr:aromatic amino acid transport family protein [Chlamydiales bacterium]